jgi:hypothetical protein
LLGSGCYFGWRLRLIIKTTFMALERQCEDSKNVEDLLEIMMFSKFMKTRAAIGFGLTIGLVGLVAGIVMFDPVQIVVSVTLIGCEVDQWLKRDKA